MASGDTREQQYLGIAANGNRADLPTETCCETRTQTLTREVAERVIRLDEEVQEIKNNPDVVDIVDTYADLQAYDTQYLTDNDIIRVLNDETHGGNSTYYRLTKNPDTWTFIGEISGGGGGGGGFVVYLSHTPDLDDGEVTLYRDEQKTVPITIREILDLVSEGTYVLFKDNSQNKYYPLTWAFDWSENDVYQIAFRDINSQFYGLTSDPSASTISFATNLQEAVRPAEVNTLSDVPPRTDTVGELGQLYTDTSTMHTYQCTAISGDRYTWTQRW